MHKSLKDSTYSPVWNHLDNYNSKFTFPIVVLKLYIVIGFSHQHCSSSIYHIVNELSWNQCKFDVKDDSMSLFWTQTDVRNHVESNHIAPIKWIQV